MSIDASIIICTRNRAASVGGTLKSLAAIETGFQWEALLVDSSTTDDTAKVIGSADNCDGRLRYLYRPGLGLGAARDAAWKEASGKILCFTDDDCYLAPDFINAVMRAFSGRPNAGCIGGRILLFDSSDAPTTIDERTQPVRMPPYSFAFPGMLHGANMAFRREALEASGGFDPAFGAGTPYPCEDIDAVASILWSGYEAWFDPRPVIYHHHRRKLADLPKLHKAYDLGRGAFYAKWSGRPGARLLFTRKWITSPKHNPYYTLENLSTEIGSSLRYVRQFQGTFVQIRICCIALSMLGVIGLVRLKGLTTGSNS